MTGKRAAPGRFLVLEGVEGAGKSTQAARLAEWLRGQGLRVEVAREPGGTGVGERIRELLLHERGSRIGAPTELLLVLAARAAFVREIVKPALDEGVWVVSDRFALSTFAYQGFGRGISRDRIAALNDYATGGLAPDLCLVLDLPVEDGLARKGEDAPRDRIESEGLDFLRRVRQGYLKMAVADARAVLVRAGGPPSEVESLVRREVSDRMTGTWNTQRAEPPPRPPPRREGK